MKRTCPYCSSVVSFWSVIRPGLWGNDKIKCGNCNKELSRLWTMESLAVAAFFAVIQLALIVVAEKYLKFGFFIDIALLVASLTVVLIAGSGVIYYLLPFKGKTESE